LDTAARPSDPTFDCDLFDFHAAVQLAACDESRLCSFRALRHGVRLALVLANGDETIGGGAADSDLRAWASMPGDKSTPVTTAPRRADSRTK
jgi:hypothetical protein